MAWSSDTPAGKGGFYSNDISPIFLLLGNEDGSIIVANQNVFIVIGYIASGVWIKNA